MNCTCNSCGRSYVYKRNKGGTKSKCNSCEVNQRRIGLKRKALDYKGSKCARCGYSECEQALDFHHIDPTKKDFNISGSHSRSWGKIVEELDKCILVCSNCHRSIHAQLPKAVEWLEQYATIT